MMELTQEDSPCFPKIINAWLVFPFAQICWIVTDYTHIWILPNSHTAGEAQVGSAVMETFW